MIVAQAAVSHLGQWERKLAEKSKPQQLHDVKSSIIIHFLEVRLSQSTYICTYVLDTIPSIACIAQFVVVG